MENKKVISAKEMTYEEVSELMMFLLEAIDALEVSVKDIRCVADRMESVNKQIRSKISLCLKTEEEEKKIEILFNGNPVLIAAGKFSKEVIKRIENDLYELGNKYGKELK